LTTYAEVSEELQVEITKVLQDNAVTIGENMQVIDGFVKTGTSYVYTHP
jgi:hypothetical protein